MKSISGPFKCARCKATHLRYRDHEHTRPASYCKACHAAKMREKRPRHSELTPEARAKANARSYANVYQGRGKLVPRSCEGCGQSAEKHHEDYAKPLNVRWFCRACHIEHHRSERVEHARV